MSGNKYNNGKIYKIVDVGYNHCYYGSTVQPLSKRMMTHRSIYTLFKNGGITAKPSACDIFDIYGLENCKIELVELFPCNSKEELRKKEGEYIKNNECINKHVAGRSQKDYKNDNREHINMKKREWQSKHKERINEGRRIKNKQFRVENPDLAKERDHMDYLNRKDYHTVKNREWKALHQSEVKNYNNKYYHMNKDKLNQKHECPICNGSYSYRHRTEHDQSRKHQYALRLHNLLKNLKRLGAEISKFLTSLDD